MKRYSLKRVEGDNRVYYATLGSINKEGRQTLFNLVMLEDGREIPDMTTYVQHVCATKKEFKKLGLKEGDYVRFTAKAYLYKRWNSSEEYSVRPNTNLQKMDMTLVKNQYRTIYDQAMKKRFGCDSKTLIWRWKNSKRYKRAQA